METTEEAPETAGEKLSRPASKRGVPRVTIDTAIAYARGVWGAARSGEAPAVAVARQISGKATTKASGGGWRAKLAAMRLYGFVPRTGDDQLQLTPLGLRVVNDSDDVANREARREALLAIGPYSKFLAGADGTPLQSEAALAGVFEYEYSMSTADAAAAATVFVESARSVDLVDAEGVVRLSAVEEEEVERALAIEEDVKSDEQMQRLTEEPSPEPPHTPREGGNLATPSETPMVGAEAQSARTSPRASIEVTLDMSEWDKDDVIAVLQTLGFTGSDER